MLPRALPYLSLLLGLALSRPAAAQDPDGTEGGWFDDEPEEPLDEGDEPETDAGDRQTDEADTVDTQAPAVAEPVPDVAEVEAAQLPRSYYESRRKFLRPIPGATPPDGYELSERNRQGLWAAGIGVSAGLYLLSVVTSAAVADAENEEDIFRYGSFPLIGPFIAAGYRRVSGPARGLLVGLGIGQLGGFAMIVGGVSARVPVWRRQRDRASADIHVSPGAASVSVAF